MARRGIQTSVHYPAAHRFSIYSRAAAKLPTTEHVTDHEITLPLFPRMTDAIVGEVVAALSEALAG